ncbi:DUF257 family protein [Pyrococcus abyssi]|uniref:KaiC-like domain-containing protein n=1 Tax=Pyrococcus abyssi (strain GE5 / Orsay) TaxID=272844 RepID=Q9UXY7_PYRAB|nr:DUF257 family protein [Pyrococcus abyssi]CAB50626.1 Hypothetical protein PAB1217 [Pyrococcus abyssi GE5]CCE71193.1 TPA: hypothetical protein PAB1217 [Pyrococcus abyssi GE5]
MEPQEFERYIGATFVDKALCYDVILHSSYEPIDLIFYMVLNALKEREIPYIIVDIMDQLSVLRNHLRLLGLKTDVIDSAKVVKLGGFIKTGNVVKRIEIGSDIGVWRKQLFITLEKHGEKDGFTINVGLERLLKTMENNYIESELFFTLVGKMALQDPNGKGIVFINSSFLKKDIVLELIELASRVFRVKISGVLGSYKLIIRPIKSINFMELEEELVVDLKDLPGYLLRYGNIRRSESFGIEVTPE